MLGAAWPDRPAVAGACPWARYAGGDGDQRGVRRSSSSSDRRAAGRRSTRQRIEPPVEPEPAAVVRADRMLTPGAFEDRQSLRRAAHRRCASASSSCFALLAVSFWLLQVVQHAKYEEMADEQPPADDPAARAARRALRSRRRVLVENRVVVHDRDRARAAPTNLDDTIARAGRGHRRRRSGRFARSCSAAGASRSFRPIARHRARDVRSRCAVRARQLELPEVVVQQVPTRTYPTAAWRRTCSATSARSRKRSSIDAELRRPRARRDRRPDRPRAHLQRAG